MIRKLFLAAAAVMFLAFGLPPVVHAQILIEGVSDRSVYTDQVNVRVRTVSGYDYDVRLNGRPMATDEWLTIDRMDYYELHVRATRQDTGSAVERLVRFIVVSSNRGSPERGLIQWTPYPMIPSTAEEAAGAELHVVTPAAYPQGLHIPVIAYVVNPDGSARRVNGTVSAVGFEDFPLVLRRGFGSTFLPAAAEGGVMQYDARFRSLQATRQITIEPSTAWKSVAGTLSGTAAWPAGSRIRVVGDLNIPAGSVLTIEAGTVVRLDPLVNIRSNGRIEIHGTVDEPVVFTAGSRVAPEQHAGAWGGFILRGSGARLVATGTIFTGGGGAANFRSELGPSHRSEQPVFLMSNGAGTYLTNCYVIETAGQVGNGLDSDLILDHCLIQGAITCGEYEGGTVIVNHSAIMEFPADDGVVDAQIADADYDGIYFTTGTHILINSLFGWAKDDAIDSGSGGAGTVVVSNCWVESALHEALAWSGGGRVTHSEDTVLINCGQGIECGWSSGGNSPLCYANRLLSTANSVGARFGDNYDWTYNGFLQVTNSLLLYNYRDIFGMNWADWTWRVNQMDLHDNLVTTLYTNHPNNTLWDPATDGSRLAPFMTTPPDAPVGIGFATWTGQAGLDQVTNGLPVRLSSFTTHPVSVDYVAQDLNGTTLLQGTLQFEPGESLKWIPLPIADAQSRQLIRVALRRPVQGEITGRDTFYFVGTAGGGAETLIARGAVWKYLDTGVDAGTAWRELTYDDSAWKSGPAELGYGDGDEATVVSYGPDPNNKYITTYFRHSFVVEDPDAYGSLSFWLKSDDGAVAYLNGVEFFRTPNMPAGAINYRTTTTSSRDTTDTGTVPVGLLRAGSNIVAVEVHQRSGDSSDISFDFELTGRPAPRVRMVNFGDRLLLYWQDGAFELEEADAVTGPWRVMPAGSPVEVVPSRPHQFFRLRSP